MTPKLFVVFCILPLGSTLDFAQQAGTLPMQVLMLAAVLFLGGYIIKSNNARETENRQRHQENQTQYNDLSKRMQEREEAFDKERQARITSLMSMIQSDTTAKNNISSAIMNNTTAIEQLKDFIKDQNQALRQLIKKDE